MEMAKAASMARELMDGHGLRGWRLDFDRARRRAGVTRYAERTSSLSSRIVPLCTVDQVRDTVLHEIAHALVGPEHGHGPVWKKTAVELGALPRATARGLPTPPAPWVGRCPEGHTVERFRRPRSPVSCAKCSPRFDKRFQLRWVRR